MKPTPQRAYDVYLLGRLIDTLFEARDFKTRAERAEEVRKSLINHDGYSPLILVRERAE